MSTTSNSFTNRLYTSKKINTISTKNLDGTTTKNISANTTKSKDIMQLRTWIQFN